MFEPSRYNPTADTDDWEDQPSQGPFYQWGLGVALPIGMAAYGTVAIATQQIDIGGRNGGVLFLNWNAIALGGAIVSAAGFIHCHYFWGNIHDQAWFAVLGKIVGALGFVAGLVFVLIRNGMMGIR